MTPEEIELLSELTIIIPTYNRPLELERSIEYWRKIPLEVLILDGSPKAYFEERQIVNDAGFIFYYSIPKALSDTFESNFWERINFGCDLVKSKYVMLIADDDFATLHGILEALVLLERDDSLDAVIGKCAGFSINEGEVAWTNLYKDWNDSQLLQSEDLFTRLEITPNKYFVVYGVMRLEKRLEINQAFKQFLPSDSRVMEFMMHQLGLAFCRTTMLSTHLWVRSVTDVPSQFISKSTPISESERIRVIEVLASAFKKIDPKVPERLILEIANKKADWLLNFSESKRSRKEKTLNEISRNHKLTFLVTCLAFAPSFSKRLLLLLAVVFRSFEDVGRKFEQLSADIPEKFEDRKQFEKLLLMPREELRLRANI